MSRPCRHAERRVVETLAADAGVSRRGAVRASSPTDAVLLLVVVVLFVSPLVIYGW